MIYTPNKLAWFYSNIYLSDEEKMRIGDIFNHKEKVTLKLKDNNSYFSNINNAYELTPLSNTKNQINFQNNNLNNNLINRKSKIFLKPNLFFKIQKN